MSVASEAMEMATDPGEYFSDSITRMGSLPRAKMEDMQLAALQQRFSELRDRIPMLKRLADNQNITEITKVEDVVPLVFEHSMYKSYPKSFLENYDFVKINGWLNKLTAHDISGIDVSDCQSIDSWLDRMEKKSPLRITHSSGTTGTMSFLPHDVNEYDRLGRTIAMVALQRYGEDNAGDKDKAFQVIFPFYRSGYSSMLRGNDQYAKWIAKSEENFHTAFPYKMSSDILYLAARVRFAQLRGTLDRLEISDELLARQREFEQREAEMPQILSEFFQKMFSELKGERIFTVGTWNLLLNLAQQGFERGEENLFASDSVVLTGGGAKGLIPPDNWKEEIARFIGIPSVSMNYAMSEVMGFHKMCSHGRYHIVPWVIPFILDPDTSEILPRKGVVTGRAAFFDLLARNHWGGFISGDEVTIDWDSKCECGQEGYHLGPAIQRYSEKSGDDDKITCAATPAAHQDAMDFLSTYVST